MQSSISASVAVAPDLPAALPFFNGDEDLLQGLHVAGKSSGSLEGRVPFFPPVKPQPCGFAL